MVHTVCCNDKKFRVHLNTFCIGSRGNKQFRDKNYWQDKG